jgi:uncharacterized protein YkwD
MLLCPVAAHCAIDVVAVANSVRLKGCGGKHGADTALITDKRLIDAARRLSKGAGLQTAMDGSAYRAMRSASLRVEGADSTDVMVKTLTQGFCSQLVDPQFHELGAFTRGDEVWLVLATPLANRNPGKLSAVTQQILQLTNEARARERRCGDQQFSPAGPLKLMDELSSAALVHSRDMAEHAQLRHQGADGSTPADRVAAEGYKWRTVGENVAVGPVAADEVVTGWLASPGHCANIMNAAFSEMGGAYMVSDKGPSRVYWTQVFAAPR